jgi:hypothetical protein
LRNGSNGIGTGMTSPRINARPRKSGVSIETTWWNERLTSAGDSPAAARLTSQIGM